MSISCACLSRPVRSATLPAEMRAVGHRSALAMPGINFYDFCADHSFVDDRRRCIAKNEVLEAAIEAQPESEWSVGRGVIGQFDFGNGARFEPADTDRRTDADALQAGKPTARVNRPFHNRWRSPT